MKEQIFLTTVLIPRMLNDFILLYQERVSIPLLDFLQYLLSLILNNNENMYVKISNPQKCINKFFCYEIL